MKKKNHLLVLSLVLAVLISTILINSAPVVEEKKKDKTWAVTIDSVPKTLDEFKAMRNKLALTPQGGMIVYLIAHLIMIDNSELGEKCLIISLDQSQLAKRGAGTRGIDVEGWMIGSSEKFKLFSSGFLKGKSYIAKSFVSGTSTDKGYALPPLPYTFIINKHSYQDADPEIWKGHVNTSCNDSGYVPIHVKVNNKGIWKVYNSSSFYAGCKPPPVKVDDDL